MAVVGGDLVADSLGELLDLVDVEADQPGVFRLDGQLELVGVPLHMGHALGQPRARCHGRPGGQAGRHEQGGACCGAQNRLKVVENHLR